MVKCPEGIAAHSTSTTVAQHVYIPAALYDVLVDGYKQAQSKEPKLRFSRYICRLIERALNE